MKGDKHRTLAESLSAVVQQLGLASCPQVGMLSVKPLIHASISKYNVLPRSFFSTILQSEDMEEEQAHTCIDIGDSDATAALLLWMIKMTLMMRHLTWMMVCN